MRGNIDDARATNVKSFGAKWETLDIILSGSFRVTRAYGNVLVFDTNGVERDVYLPTVENGLWYIIFNSGSAGMLNILDSEGVDILSLAPQTSAYAICTDNGWFYFGDIFGAVIGTTRTITGVSATITASDLDVLTNRVGDMTLTLPTADARVGRKLRLTDIGIPSPSHVITLLASGSDTFHDGSTSYTLYHNGTDAPRVELWPYADNNLWVVK